MTVKLETEDPEAEASPERETEVSPEEVVKKPESMVVVESTPPSQAAKAEEPSVIRAKVPSKVYLF